MTRNNTVFKQQAIFLYLPSMKKIFAIALIIAALFSPQTSFSQQKAMLNHIAVYVTNLKTSTAFYQDIIGLDTIPEPFHDGRHTWFGVGVKSHLHLIEGAKQKNSIDKNNHLCFSVASVPDFIKVLEKKQHRIRELGRR